MVPRGTSSNTTVEASSSEVFRRKLKFSYILCCVLAALIGFVLGGVDVLLPVVITSLLFVSVAAYHTRLFQQSDQQHIQEQESEHIQQQAELSHAIDDSELLKKQLANSKETLEHSEKMASLGQLAAGVAHEINNPVGFIMSNLCTFKEYMFFLDRLSKQLLDLLASLSKGEKSRHEEKIQEIEKTLKIEDLDYIISDSNSLIEESLAGAARIKEIVGSLKGYVHSSDHTEEIDINELIEQTINIVWNQIKYNCTLEKDLQTLAPLRLAPGAFNQVLLNLLMNASHAMEGASGTLTIRSFMNDTDAIVEISDTGHGIAAENLNKIFEPFFTTKPVGEGTGLGMSICYDIITNYGGKIEVESAISKGTKFTIILPTQRNASVQANTVNAG